MPSLFAPPPPGIYENTEIITFHFTDSSTPASLSDEATEVGRVWASTLQAYLEIEQTGMVWWALVHGAPQKAELFIDWKTAEGREKYEASPESEALRGAWNLVTSSPVHKAVYRFPHDDVARQAGLCSTSDTVSAHFTFKFNDGLGSSSDAGQWDAVFAQFATGVMGSPGGVVATSATYGWELNHDSYTAAFRYLNIEAMQSFLQENDASQLLEQLRSRATGGIEIEFLETRLFSHGWLGSVDKTRPENPATTAMFAEARNIFGGVNSSIVRGE
ncbi:hypothetical protein G7Z17_g1451 [Cylindrodendrum hubeiense]|uniref:Uncharacterized protein n=1 Tax=Cylindrodendrum hubeiense TaxID=595255 RepID=A0A9P5LFC0_9HYPO|nr:hypothetical protein G7Z17_g1451 [Cylindrodendrum hubeiense]